MNKIIPIEGRAGFEVVGDAPVLLRCAPTYIQWFPVPEPTTIDEDTRTECTYVSTEITYVDLVGKQRKQKVSAVKRLRIRGTLQKVDHTYDGGSFEIVVTSDPRDFIL